MKKWVIALMAALALTGCGSQPVQTEPMETTLETTTPTEPAPSCYVENSPMERGTGGAVKQYQLDQPITGLGMLGENLLVCADGQTLLLFDPERMELLRSRVLERELSWDEAGLVLSETGVAYFDEDRSAYVTLDTNLITASTVVISEPMLSQPVITRDFSDIYFASQDGIRVMHLSEGTSRLLREEHNQVLSVDGLLFEDDTLCYTRRTDSGETENCFVNAGNGQLQYTANFQGQIRSWGEHYAGLMTLDHAMGQTTWLVSGDLSGSLKRLDPDCAWDGALLLEEGWAVLQDSSQVGVTLSCYDLSDGCLVSKVIMPQQYDLFVHAGRDGSRIWLTDSSGARLYCWDTAVSGRSGGESALTDYTSLSEPDEQRLAECRQNAQVIGQRYGVEISFAEENNRTAGVDYSGYPDFRPELYNQALRTLERVLRDLPEDFLRRVGRLTDSGVLEICLVDDYDPGTKTTPATGSIDVSGGNTTVRVSMCTDLEEIFHHELFHVLEVQIMNISDGFKWWEHINPDGFAYVNSYAPYYEGKLDNSAYLKEGVNYFADGYSMISEREDRAQVFVYACMDGQEERFQSWAMQKKLGQVCEMLRECFDIPEDESPVWEQYLSDEEFVEVPISETIG